MTARIGKIRIKAGVLITYNIKQWLAAMILERAWEALHND